MFKTNENINPFFTKHLSNAYNQLYILVTSCLPINVSFVCLTGGL